VSTYDLERALADMAMQRPGWLGGFTTMVAPGAYPNGTRIMKATSEDHDCHPNGSPGTVLGSILHPKEGIAYFIEWDARPKCAVLVIAWKVAPAA
jgi:hypothetical protein